MSGSSFEALQDHTGEDRGPSLDAWLASNRQKAIELLKTDDEPDFTANCRQKVGQAVKLDRYTLWWPLTAYTERELEVYKAISILIRSEQVSIIDQNGTAGLAIPNGDLMLFDGRRVITNMYDQNGRTARLIFMARVLA